MLKHIAAISFIFVITALAWTVLGATIFARTYSSRSGLDSRVASAWGAPQEQRPASAWYSEVVTRTETTVEGGRALMRRKKETVSRHIPLDASRINVTLDLEHRQKGLLWYATYKVAFAGAYSFRNPTAEAQIIRFSLPLPVAQAVYDDVNVTVDGRPASVTTEGAEARAATNVGPGETVTFLAAYRSQGLDSWRYGFGKDVAQVRDFSLAVDTNFGDIDFPDNTLAPTSERRTPRGWELTWNYKNLLSGFAIGVTMPQKLQPGPLAGEISFFAPVSLLFFFFLMLVITTLRRIELHPMNYFFLACAFFSFHLLLAYLADRAPIHIAFLICSAVSIFLVVSYLRLVAGIRFAAVEAGLAQFVYLVLFSYAFFLKGFTGLAITIGSIVTLFAVMQMTGRIRWTERFARTPAGAPARG